MKPQTARRLVAQVKNDPAHTLASAVCVGCAVSSMLIGRKRTDVLDALDKDQRLALKIGRFVVERWAEDALESDREPSYARMREMVDQIIAMKDAS